MNDRDPFLMKQLPVIQKIIDDETWLEGERRGRPVSAHDPLVRERVCLIVMNVGASLREALEHSRVAGT